MGRQMLAFEIKKGNGFKEDGGGKKRDKGEIFS